MLQNAIARAGKLSNAQQRIAEYVVKHEQDIPFMTEGDIADQAGVSIATVSRFWGTIGYDNLKDVKKKLQTTTGAPPASKMKDRLSRIQTDDIVGQVISMEINHLQETLQYLSMEHFERAVDLLQEARAIYVFGTGPSRSLTELMCFRLNRFGMRMVPIALGVNDMFEQLVHVGSGDVLVVFAFHGYPRDIRTVMKVVQGAQSRIILVTDMLTSELHSMAASVLYVHRGEPHEFHSMVAPIAVIDAVTVSLAGREKSGAMERLNKLYELRKTYKDPSGK
jgi:DNA-binding MurR/RpiR family transcriptional regulator